MKKSLVVAIGVLLGIGGWCRADEASCRQAVEKLFNQTGMPAALDQMVLQISATLTGAAPEDANYGDAMNAYVRKTIGWDAMKDELIALYELGCEARGHGAAPVTADDIAAIRARMDDLARQWAAVPLNGSLILSL